MRTGVFTAAELTDAGWTRWQIGRAVASGNLRQLRKGWYAEQGANSEAVRAVHSGGALGCMSALRMYGVWVPESKHTHIRSSGPLHDRYDWIRRCPADRHRKAPRTAVDPLPTALASALRCLTRENRIAVIDSVLHKKLMTENEVREVLSTTHGHSVRLLEECDASAESGTESLVRTRLRALGLDVQTQVTFAGVGRVDLVVGDRLVIEVDSRAHHTSEENYLRDRFRDLRLLSMGFLVIRLTYEQVMHGWWIVEPFILAMTDRREHLQSTFRPVRL